MITVYTKMILLERHYLIKFIQSHNSLMQILSQIGEKSETKSIIIIRKREKTKYDYNNKNEKKQKTKLII